MANYHPGPPIMQTFLKELPDNLNEAHSPRESTDEPAFEKLVEMLTGEEQNKVSKQYVKRFLRENDGDLDVAAQGIRHYIEWCEKHQPEKLLDKSYQIPPSLQYYWPGQYHGFDREGRPVYLSRAGSIDMHGFMNIDGVTDADRERFHIYNLQLGEYFMKEATKICSRTVDQIVVIYDLKDIPISQISPKFVVFLIKLID